MLNQLLATTNSPRKTGYDYLITDDKEVPYDRADEIIARQYKTQYPIHLVVTKDDKNIVLMENLFDFNKSLFVIFTSHLFKSYGEAPSTSSLLNWLLIKLRLPEKYIRNR